MTIMQENTCYCHAKKTGLSTIIIKCLKRKERNTHLCNSGNEKRLSPAEAVVADIREPKSVVPSEAPPSELGFTRQLLKDGGEEKVVPPPGRNDESEKLRKSEEGAEGVLLALVNRRPGERERQVENGDNDRQGRRSKGMKMKR